MSFGSFRSGFTSPGESRLGLVDEVISGFPALLNATRVTRKLTVTQCAKQLGVSASTLSGWEAGRDLTVTNFRRAIHWIEGVK